MGLDLCKIDWVAVSAVASFAMVVITWFTLQQMKRQWEEERRPNLTFSIAISQVWYVLKISNIGKQNASDIKINFNKEFVDNLLKENIRKTFRDLHNKSFVIEAGCSKYFLICSCEEVEKMYNKINITGKYCGKYTINDSLNIDEYVKSLIVNDALTTDIGDIRKGLVILNNSHYPIQKSLDIIAKYLLDNKRKTNN